MAASNTPIHHALNAVVSGAQQMFGSQVQVAIWLKNPLENTLSCASHTGLPDEYVTTLDRFPVGQHQPSCGKVLYIGHSVMVKDVKIDPGWAPHLALAERCHVRACWSFFLSGPDGRPLGTLAVYHRVPAEPDGEKKEILEFFATIASLLVARHLQNEEKHRSQSVSESLLTVANQNLRQSQEIALHELRNPVHALKLTISTMEAARSQGKPLDGYIQSLRKQVNVMDSLISDMTAEQTAAPGSFRLDKTSVLIQDLIHCVHDSLCDTFTNKGQTLAINLPDAPLYVEADESRLIQMVSNLLTNANKFTGNGGKIVLSVKREESDVLIQVQDEGIGLNEDSLKSVFDMYVRAGEGNQPGQGIGLSVVRALAELHGGKVIASSPGEGKGSCFTIRLPVKP